MNWLLWAALLAAQPAHQVCAPCHTGPAGDFDSHPHKAKGLSCDACHGASKGHIEASGNRPPDKVAGPADQRALCGACHAAQAKLYEASTHGKLVAARSEKRAAACTTCHGTHAVRTPAGMLVQCNRCHAATLPESCKQDPPVAARLRCAGCHNPHSLARR